MGYIREDKALFDLRTVLEEELPLLLPEVEKYQPTGTGESPLTGAGSMSSLQVMGR